MTNQDIDNQLGGYEECFAEQGGGSTERGLDETMCKATPDLIEKIRDIKQYEDVVEHPKQGQQVLDWYREKAPQMAELCLELWEENQDLADIIKSKDEPTATLETWDLLDKALAPPTEEEIDQIDSVVAWLDRYMECSTKELTKAAINKFLEMRRK